MTRTLILQLTISHIVLFIALNVIKSNDEDTFNMILQYFVPAIVGPILLGIWGLNIMIRMFIYVVPNYNLKA